MAETGVEDTYATWWRRRWRAEQPFLDLPESISDDPHARFDARDEVWQALAKLRLDDTLITVLRRRRQAVVLTTAVVAAPAGGSTAILGSGNPAGPATPAVPAPTASHGFPFVSGPYRLVAANSGPGSTGRLELTFTTRQSP